MRKVEIVSLIIVVVAIAGVVIASQMESEILRPWIFLLSFLLFIAAGNPTFSKSKSSKLQEKNRVGRAVGWLFIGLMAVGYVLMLLSPFIPSTGMGIFPALVIYGCSLIFLIFWYRDFSMRRWMSCRLRWLTGNGKMPISQIGRGKELMLYTYKDKDGVSYAYSPSERQFFMFLTMFMNPARYEKEYEERKYQLQVRTEQTKIEHAWGISDCESSLSFKVSIRLTKKNSTKDNVCRLRDVIVDLTKDDFNQHLFTRIMVDDEEIFIEIYHYQLIRMLIVGAAGNAERYDLREETDSLSEQFFKIIDKLSEEQRLDKLRPEDLIEKDEFEHLWLNGEDSRK